MCKPDKAFPCYDHECYESGNFHRSCTACPYFKTVKSEFNRESKNMSDTDWKAEIRNNLTNKNTSGTAVTFKRLIPSHPNLTHKVKNNLNEAINNHIKTLGSIPVVDSFDDNLYADLHRIVGYMESITEETASVNLSDYGKKLLEKIPTEDIWIGFQFILDNDEVKHIIKAAFICNKQNENIEESEENSDA